MPRTRRRGPSPRGLTRLGWDDREMLLTGNCFLRGSGERHGDDPGLRRLWELHGAKLLADAIEAAPGHRPWGWWHYDAPDEPRAADEPPLAWLVRIGAVGAGELALWEARRREHAAEVADFVGEHYGYQDVHGVPTTLAGFIGWWRETVAEGGAYSRELRDEPWHRLQA